MTVPEMCPAQLATDAEFVVTAPLESSGLPSEFTLISAAVLTSQFASNLQSHEQYTWETCARAGAAFAAIAAIAAITTPTRARGLGADSSPHRDRPPRASFVRSRVRSLARFARALRSRVQCDARRGAIARNGATAFFVTPYTARTVG